MTRSIVIRFMAETNSLGGMPPMTFGSNGSRNHSRNCCTEPEVKETRVLPLETFLHRLHGDEIIGC